MSITFYHSDGPTILEDVSTGEVIIGPERAMHITDGCLYVVFSDKSTGGAVEIATAHNRGFTGKWAVRQLVTWKEGGRSHYVGLAGMHLAIRVRVVEDIHNGTISVYGAGTAR